MVRVFHRMRVPQQVVNNEPEFGSIPLSVTCFYCQAEVTTKTIESTNIVCCIIFGCLTMCCPGCKNVEHRCPQCNVILGFYKPTNCI